MRSDPKKLMRYRYCPIKHFKFVSLVSLHGQNLPAHSYTNFTYQIQVKVYPFADTQASCTNEQAQLYGKQHNLKCDSTVLQINEQREYSGVEITIISYLQDFPRCHSHQEEQFLCCWQLNYRVCEMFLVCVATFCMARTNILCIFVPYSSSEYLV